MKSVFPWKMEGAGVSLPSARLRLPPQSNRLCLALAPPSPGAELPWGPLALGAAPGRPGLLTGTSRVEGIHRLCPSTGAAPMDAG